MAVAGVCTLEKYDLTSYGKHGRAKEGVRTRDKWYTHGQYGESFRNVRRHQEIWTGALLIYTQMLSLLCCLARPGLNIIPIKIGQQATSLKFLSDQYSLI